MSLSAAAAKSLQSCPTLCDPIDGSPPGSAIPGILQARTLEWVAISFSNAWKWKVKVKSLSHARLLLTPWTAAYQAPLSMGIAFYKLWITMLYTSKLLYITYTSILQKKNDSKDGNKSREQNQLRGWGQEPKMQSWKPPITAWPWSSNQ